MEAMSEQSESPSLEDEKVVDISKAHTLKGPSAQELRERKKVVDRVRRWQNQHADWPANFKKSNPEADEETTNSAFWQAALRAIDRENYERLPAEKKILRLERMVSQMTQGIMGDLQALRHNDRIITEVFDVNLRSISLMFEHLGITKAKQAEILTQVQMEIEQERIQSQQKQASEALTEEVDAEPGTEDELLDPPEEATEF